MYAKNQSKQNKQKGIALIVAMLFVMVFSALSVAMFSMSSGNSLVASNLHKVNAARSSAESGLEVVHYYLAQAEIPPMTDKVGWFGELKRQLFTEILPSEISKNYDFNEDTGVGTVTVGSTSPVALDSDRFFTAKVWDSGVSGDRINILVTGNAHGIERKIQGSFNYGVRKKSVFDYGVASKGAVTTSNISMDGVNLRIEADMYIESMTNNQALTIGNSQVAGDVKIVNPDGYVSMTGNSSIGGETGINALQNHVEVGVDPTEFPYPNTSHFEQFVNGITINSDNIDSYSSNATLDNVRIAPGTNPTFDGNTTINGVMYIEQPNVVTFGGTATITGVIIGNGDMNDNSGTNQLLFGGTVNSSSVASLPESYGELRDETGTFVMAPGFAVSMGGDFGTLNGCIVANGFKTYGGATGTIGGSIVNYSPETMVLGGNDLYFNRSGLTDIPAGLVQEIVVYYDPSTYDEGPF
jgi:hypothetical protein